MNTAATLPAAAAACPDCHSEWTAGTLACPGCQRLVHAQTLKTLAERAAAAARDGDTHSELVAWRASLELLPPGSTQYEWVAERVVALSDHADWRPEPAPPPPASGRWKWLAGAAPLAFLAWKFKFLIVALVTKGKLLLLGLTKASTLASMFATVGVYWSQWGLWFALGLVGSIYVHEMGHVAALRRYGIAASAPMFIPGFGALVRLKQAPLTPREDARIGLAGPVWGLGAAVVAALAGLVTGNGLWLAIARTGAWINLFNLMPIWQLDGSRAFASLTAARRWVAVVALAAAWRMTGDGLVLLVTLVAGVRALGGGADVRPDRGALALYVLVTLGLAIVFRVSFVSLAR
jgi:Zn-dependent protease